ncbi:MAG: hypothetical protein DMF89_25715 [Acidobacteria bacterium]|nr:MAG: hypothetical protein DMF89_25715 [Acidobacteriota bacterium]
MSMWFRSHTVAVVAALLCLAPAAVEAAYTSTVAGSTATMTGDAAGDTLTITQAGGLFSHNRFAAGDPGFNSAFDFDTAVAGDQTLSSTTGIININAGDGNDTIALGDGVNIRGAIDGGPGTADTLDYSAYSTAISANLGLGTTGLTATLGADQENPATTHGATGTATVSNYSIVTHTFDITVTVTGITPAEVTGFHIHQATVGVNGPIIVDFVPLGGLTPVGTGFTFTMTGLTLPAVNEAAFLGGGTYVNVHTAVFPGGAIRGQLFSGGNVNLATGAATGTTAITNIENVTGGTGNDSLVGSFAINTINGGAGADWIVGGPGNDVLNGGAGADVIVWSNGDGSDVDEGGTESDTVQVNGSTAAADIFTVTANGTRLRFDRTNLGLFSLDIGTTEKLIVNGIGGNDAFTVNDLTGVASLTAVSLYGFDGGDIFTYVPTSTALTFTAHGGPGTDTLQGPNGASSWNVTAANQGNIAGLVTSFRFIEALVGGTASDVFNVRAFATGTPTVDGGGAPGTDTLNYNADSRPISGDTTPPDGSIDSPGVQSLIFTQIETVNVPNPPFLDLSGDGKADLVWRNARTGDVAVWLMDGVAVTQGPVVASGVPLEWIIVSMGDFYGDRKADLVWRNTRAGDVAVWLMDGVTVRQGPVVASGVPLEWQIAGVGDLGGDQKADLVWRHTTTGDVAVWLMNGVTATLATVVAPGVPLAWQIEGVEDVDADGKVDLVWRESGTGNVAVWLMDGVTIRQGPVVAPGVPGEWQIQ